MGMRRLVLSDNELVKRLRVLAHEALRVDGDRDHMNHSDLTCQQSMAIVQLMRAAADRISGVSGE